MSDWRDRGACAGHPDPELWFPAPTDRGRVLAAVAICRSCPVQNECATEAIRERLDEGIWGALTEDTRRAMRRNAGAPPVCRNGHPRTPENTGVNRHGGKACLICDSESADKKRRRDRERNRRNNLARSTA